MGRGCFRIGFFGSVGRIRFYNSRWFIIIMVSEFRMIVLLNLKIFEF